jgi:hypothetical protein
LVEASANLEAQMRKIVAAEGIPAASWRAELAVYMVGVRAARGKLYNVKREETKDGVQYCQQNRWQGAIMAAHKVVQSGDLVDIEHVHRQLSAKASEMEEMAVSMEGSTSPQDKVKLQEAEMLLRRLERRKQWLEGKISAVEPQYDETPPLEKGCDGAPAPPVATGTAENAAWCLLAAMADRLEQKIHGFAEVVLQEIEEMVGGGGVVGSGGEQHRREVKSG